MATLCMIGAASVTALILCNPKNPIFDLVSIDMTVIDNTSFDAELAVTFRLSNPNFISGGINSSVTISLFNGTDIIASARVPEITLASKSSKEFRIQSRTHSIRNGNRNLVIDASALITGTAKLLWLGLDHDFEFEVKSRVTVHPKDKISNSKTTSDASAKPQPSSSSSSKRAPSLSNLPQSSVNPALLEPLLYNSRPSLSPTKPLPLTFKSTPSTGPTMAKNEPAKTADCRSDSKPSLPSPMPHLTFTTTLSPAPTKASDETGKTDYVLVEENNSSLPLYLIPKRLEDLIKKDIVPQVLTERVSPCSYKEYFASLLYAEDFYLEKWAGYALKNVTLKLHEAAIYQKPNKNKHFDKKDKMDDKIFVAFEIDSVPERRPFLLSRDKVHARPSGRNSEPFQGFIYRVAKGNLLLADFGQDFFSQYHSTQKYDISFSFNRVCLKRAHQAIQASSDTLFSNFLFPDCISRNKMLPNPTTLLYNRKLDQDQKTAVGQILSLKGSPPYLVEGPLCVSTRAEFNKEAKELSRTGVVIREAVFQIYQTCPNSRILICGPTNRTCDVLLRHLKELVPEQDMFRAIAAFRPLEEVPDDVLPSCLYDEENFHCPSRSDLLEFRVILSTFMSVFRLHGGGLSAGHFSHIFLLDASSATEPETIVPLANLASKETVVIITGKAGNRSRWVRSDIARKHGLWVSLFERLSERSPYRALDPSFAVQVNDQRIGPNPY